MQSESKDGWPAPVGLLCTLPGNNSHWGLCSCATPDVALVGPGMPWALASTPPEGAGSKFCWCPCGPISTKAQNAQAKGQWPPPPRYQGVGAPGRALGLELQPCRAKGSQQRDPAGLFCQALRVIWPSPQVWTADHRVKDYP